MPEPTFTVLQVAERIGVTDTTVRNWTRKYAAHLSDGANPPTGIVRQYSTRDVNVLRFIASSVAEKRSHVDISARLDSASFSEIVVETPETDSRSYSSNEGAIVAPGPTSTVDYAPVLYDLVQVTEKRHDETVSRLDRLERQRHGMWMWVAGFAAGVALVVLALLLLRLMA